jgi:site-specific DNA-methyltransferase (adenine-specific)
MPSESVDLVITSPPYFQQRQYDTPGIGNEETLEEYINNLILVFKECVRVTKDTGSIVFNIGDKYQNGNLLLVPYRFAIKVQEEQIANLINELTWVKVNPTPKQDQKKLVPSKEPFFIFAKTGNYYFDKSKFMKHKDILFNGKSKNRNGIGMKYFELIENSSLSENQKELAKQELFEVIQEVKSGQLHSFRMKIKDIHALPYGGQAGGRLNQINNKGFTIIKIYGNSLKRDIIESTVETIKGNIHPAVYPEYVIQEIISLLSKENSIILDPFIGSGTTAVVARKLNRQFIGIDISEKYIEYAKDRIEKTENNYSELFL